MGILHYSDRQKGIVFVVWDGQVTWAYWYKHVRMLLADPDWPMISRFIVDLQSVTDTSSIGDEEKEPHCTVRNLIKTSRNFFHGAEVRTRSERNGRNKSKLFMVNLRRV